MPASTLQEFESFARFARTRLENPESECSIEECLHEWRERDEVIAAVMQGRRDFEAGLCSPADEALDRIHRQLGIPQ